MVTVWRCSLLAQHFAESRPYLYHLTDRSNLDHIRETKTLFPAATLMERAGRTELLRVRRHGYERVTIGKTVILLRDQAPLHRGNLRLPNGFSFEDFVESLNQRVFFWPGTAAGPISYGLRHFERYRQESPVLLRIDYRSLLLANSSAVPLYCRYNSGSPRCSDGRKSPRGPDTFVSTVDFDGTPSQVVEVTFSSDVDLPTHTEFGSHRPGRGVCCCSG